MEFGQPKITAAAFPRLTSESVYKQVGIYYMINSKILLSVTVWDGAG